jgi:hypothetical protein
MDNTAPSAPSSAPVDVNAPANTEAAPKGETPVEKEERIRLNTNVKGKKEERDYTKAELEKWVQLGLRSDESFQKGASATKQAEQLIRMLQDDPISVLTNPKLNIPGVREKVEKWLHSQLEGEMLSPAEKKQKEMEEELRKYRDQDEKVKKDAEKEQLSKLEQHYVGEYDKKITAALSTSGLPKTPQTLKMITQLMAKALDAGYDAEPSDLVPLVKEHYMSAIRELFGATEGDALIGLVGDDFTNKVRKADVARLRNGQFKPQAKETATSSPNVRQDSSKRMSMSDYDAQMKETIAKLKRGEI